GKENILKAKLSQLHCESNMFHWIWSYRKYSKGQSLTSLFFVMLVDNVYDSKMAEESRSWRLYPVFRCRRCVDETGHSSNVDCCMSYVSQYSIADSWKRFVTHTGFGAGIMVTPNLGVYKQIDGRVELKTYSTTQMCYPNMEDKPITPESLKKASRMTIKHRKIIIQSDPFMVFPEPVYDFCPVKRCSRRFWYEPYIIYIFMYLCFFLR
ncbi:GD13388, partial [Drosophila simulans]